MFQLISLSILKVIQYINSFLDSSIHQLFLCPQFPADLVTFTKRPLMENFIFCEVVLESSRSQTVVDYHEDYEAAPLKNLFVFKMENTTKELKRTKKWNLLTSVITYSRWYFYKEKCRYQQTYGGLDNDLPFCKYIGYSREPVARRCSVSS